ncbi:MAG: hypothetical protein RJA44_1481, partial [Pseudomonadota bacterium]
GLRSMLGTICAFILLSLALVTWTHQRWCDALEDALLPIDSLHQVHSHMLEAQLHAERLEHDSGNSSRELVEAELSSARAEGRLLLLRAADTDLLGNHDSEADARLVSAVREYTIEIEQVSNLVRQQAGLKSNATTLALRNAQQRMDEATLKVEASLLQRIVQHRQRQDQLTALMLALIGVLGVVLMAQLTQAQQHRNRDLATLAASEARLRAFTAALPDTSYLLDEQGTCLDIFNLKGSGDSAQGRLLQGRRIDSVLPPEAGNRVRQALRAAIESRNTVSCEYQLGANGRWVEGRASLLPAPPGPARRVLAWVSWDITERKQAEARVADLTRLYSFQSQVSQAIVWARDEPTLYERFCSTAVSHGHFSAAWVLQIDPLTQRATTAVRCLADGLTLDTPDYDLKDPQLRSHAVARALKLGIPCWQSHVTLPDEALPGSSPDSKDPFDRVVVPVRHHEQVVALLVMARPRIDATNAEERALYTELSTDLSFAIASLRREQAWHEAQGRVRLHAAALEATQDGVMVTDLNADIVSVNRAFTEITGYSEADAVGQNARLLRSDQHDAEIYRQIWVDLREQGRWQGEIWNKRKSGDLYVQWMSIGVVPDAQGLPSHYVAVFTDITQQKAAKERLQHLAHYDVLTNLPNRLLVLARLDQALARAERHDQHIAVLFIDLDNFKTVNDSMGHAAGDDLLRGVAERLSRRTRREDTLGRLGGDEFILLLENLRDPQEAAVVAQELLQLLQMPFPLGHGQEVYVQASIGISVYPGDASEAGELVRNADAAMYQAKRAGRNTCRYYTEALTSAAVNRLALDTRLRRAIENDEFELWYQPLHAIDPHEPLRAPHLIGLEALVRLNQPGLPPIGPTEFIPMLEESGLIVALGQWVTREACRQGRAWLDEGLDFGAIAINLSPVEARRGGVPGRIREALQASGLPPERLEIEITESGLMEQSEQAMQLLAELRQIGVRLAIDDFGTGYSSLAYLRRFAVDKLKIDRSFVRDLAANPSDMQLVRTMVALGHNLGMKVLAEGVEHEEQLDCLRQCGCDAAQGYWFSPPRPADEARRWLLPPHGLKSPGIDAAAA